ncbi:FKBP-type peptidyl-prolyl cis-trans isomerase [Marinobacterium sp. AK62]|uniref:Peptidyl-prolyl cis-trans isomerase n=1 Tax=Marinobacterium alkalitolerans TaxID=1542925 RepID=A0ABS3Z7E3_9GAMM|nr:FKBP-type peptidyl-prolyl cis-trans isomerase [Marinobacterium alkalitolerans]MBP0047631.1 FKBP-type peptidyl-prolyl cis-trans isomerase [Marinobacterium alkalitolerans]
MAASEQLIIEDIVEGTGTEVKKGGALITAHYRGFLEDGTEFDSSYDKGQPFQTVLSRKKVIAAWVEGLKGMKVGGKRKLHVPAEMGYGERGFGDRIPPNANLVFEIELLEALNRE